MVKRNMYLELFLTLTERGMVLRFIIGQMQLFQNDIGMKKVSLKRLKVMTQTASGIGGRTRMARVISTINHISGQ